MENDPEMEREGGAGFQCDDTSGTNARNPDDGRHSANDKRQGDPAFRLCIIFSAKRKRAMIFLLTTF